MLTDRYEDTCFIEYVPHFLCSTILHILPTLHTKIPIAILSSGQNLANKCEQDFLTSSRMLCATR